jgi:hypothetical protein
MTDCRRSASSSDPTPTTAQSPSTKAGPVDRPIGHFRWAALPIGRDVEVSLPFDRDYAIRRRSRLGPPGSRVGSTIHGKIRPSTVAATLSDAHSIPRRRSCALSRVGGGRRSSPCCLAWPVERAPIPGLRSHCSLTLGALPPDPSLPQGEAEAMDTCHQLLWSVPRVMKQDFAVVLRPDA